MTIRIKINENGTATLSGVPYQRLREALIVAELHCQDGQPGIPKFKFEEDMLAYHRELLKWVKLMHGAMDVGIKNTFPDRNRPLTKEERFEKVRESERERALMQRILSEFRKSPKKYMKKVHRLAKTEKASRRRRKA